MDRLRGADRGFGVMENEPLIREYYAIFDTVNDFDKRLLTIKGWGVTLSLAALATGFQFQHYGLFLVGAISGLAFWAIEGFVKRHQMRFYPRMREIEVVVFEQSAGAKTHGASSPLIDWSWSKAGDLLDKGVAARSGIPQPYGRERWYRAPWALPHVFLPHALTVLAGCVFWVLGRQGVFGTKFGW